MDKFFITPDIMENAANMIFKSDQLEKKSGMGIRLTIDKEGRKKSLFW